MLKIYSHIVFPYTCYCIDFYKRHFHSHGIILRSMQAVETPITLYHILFKGSDLTLCIEGTLHTVRLRASYS